MPDREAGCGAPGCVSSCGGCALLPDREPAAHLGPYYATDLETVLCEQCHTPLDPVVDAKAPWSEVHFSGGTRLEVWHYHCAGERRRQLGDSGYTAPRRKVDVSDA